VRAINRRWCFARHRNWFDPDPLQLFVGRKKLNEHPIPPTDALHAMSMGWAVLIVREVVMRLHAAAGTKPPDWLVAP
jgi:hypothetical protein